MDNKDLTNKYIDDFTIVAKEYCYIVNNAMQYSYSQLVSYMVTMLPMLYLKASMLPDYDDYDREAVSKFVSEEEWTRVRLQVKKNFGEHDDYFEIQGRFGQSEQTSISENLADIYQDMKDFTELVSYELEESIIEAVGEVKKNFIDYWGQRAVNALKIIHLLYVGK